MHRGCFLYFIGALLCVVVFAVVAFELVSARRSLLNGVNELHSAQNSLQSIHSHASLRLTLAPVRNDIDSARKDFRSADNQLGLLAPIIKHLGWVPRVGVEVAAAPDIAHAARSTADGALSLLDGFGPLASEWTTASRSRNSQTLVRGLEAGGPAFDRACTQFRDAERSRHAIPGGSMPASLSSALHSLDTRLPQLLILCRALSLAPSLLGEHGSTSYLLAYQDSNELRATGGFIGSASLLTIHDGKPKQIFQSTGIDDNLSVPPPEPVENYNDEPGWLFRDSNWSPDFPTTAALERFFYRLDFHRSVANVVDVTPGAVSRILTATGPMYVPEYRREVSGANVGQLADYYAHWAPNGGAGIPARLRGKQFIGIVAGHLLSRLTTLSPSAWIRLGGALSSSVSHGDLLVNFRNPTYQSLIDNAGAAHRVTPTLGDYLFVVNTNLSYNKINPFVHVWTTYNVGIRADRWLDARLTIRLQNVPAPPAIARTGIGPGAGALGGKDDYATFLRVYTPPGSQLVDQSGWTQPWSQGPAYGGTMFSGYLIVRRGATRTVRMHYIVPPNVFSASRGKRYTLLAPHQPGSMPEALSVTLHHDGTQVSWQIAHPAVDWQVSVPIDPLPFHPIPLPKYPAPATSPGGWIEPHAFFGSPNARG